MTTTRIDHTGHGHPSTPAARKACRATVDTTLFARIAKLEGRVADLAWSIRYADVAMNRPTELNQHGQREAGLKAARAELFALVDSLTPAQAQAYGAYRKTN